MINVSNPKGILMAALIAVGLAGTYLYASQGPGLPGTVMMTSRATGTDGPTFDATKWFRNGTYVPQELDGKLNPYIMTRSKPFVFKAKDNEFLIQAAIEALEDVQPRVDTQPIWDRWPVLTQRVRYTYSVFTAPDKPADLYNLYLQVSYRRFVIGLQLDGDEGNLGFDGEVLEVDSANEEHEAYVKVFEEMDDAGTR
ncbi:MULTISPECIES: hypothetical protein [unclassified Pseudomonas]|uniref:hypothetical protein n=1 Tax=unclassified Pseudomonas TaxID=196821 RepID=UPI002AC9932C|nr:MULTISPECIES: hypothetical protein [unclassified Pseudomonas]MEB0048115.1 hypothetical protein [Pseudomonas sp. Dout3]MEB0098779.1 hypothetical protein [Pseudomonas sp. DC1.2]WPX56719.1 hypothetical protein RHM68_13705 [Pseudomonas sp. DC1.2]